MELNLDRDSGYVLLGQLETLPAPLAQSDDSASESKRPSPQGTPGVDSQLAVVPHKYGIRKFRVFVRGALTSTTRYLLPGAITGRTLVGRDAEEGTATARASATRRCRNRPGWALYSGSFDEPVDIATVELNVVSAIAYRTTGVTSREVTARVEVPRMGRSMADIKPLETTAAPGTKSVSSRGVHVLWGSLGLVAVVLFAIAFLSPTMKSAFYNDDVLNSCNAGVLITDGCRFGRWLEDGIKGSMASGRFFPLMIANVYSIHALFPGATAYHAYIMALIVVNLLQLYYLLRLWGVGPVVAQLGALAFVLLLQMRAGGDPILSHAGAMQVEVAQLLLSMICLQKFLATERVAWLVGSVLVFASALLNYEISYTFLPIYPAMMWIHTRNWRRTISFSQPYLIICVTLVVFTLGLRFHVPPGQQSLSTELQSA